MMNRWGVHMGAVGAGILTLSGAATAQEATAQEAGGSATMNLGAKGAEAEGAATAEPAEAYPEIGQDEAAAAETDEELPYMKRYRPEKNTWEVGLGGSVLFPSPGLQLVSGGSPYSAYDVAFGAVGRLGYYPLSFLGIEAEGMFAKGDVGGGRANFIGYRGNVVLQLPVASIIPFAIGGVGGLSAASGTLGHDSDFAGQFGGGVKVAFSRSVMLRAEFRENLTKRVNDEFGGVSFSEEAMLSLAFTLRPKQEAPKAPPPPPDGDRDGIPDSTDACPTVGALTDDGCPPDTDGDGVKDPDDECPRQAGDMENGCPNPDKDADGVKLPCDLCPEEAGVSPDGCPIRDKDGDGILDDADKCVEQPETQNGFEDDDGCPDEVPKEVETFTGTIQGITFLRGSSKIARSSQGMLTKAADVLKKYPSVKLEISGHTSSEGDPDFNQKLSEERAESVRSWLIDVGGVDGSRLIARGAGFSEPVADNDTPQGRAKNRRIEFKLLQKGGGSGSEAALAEEEMAQ